MDISNESGKALARASYWVEAKTKRYDNVTTCEQLAGLMTILGKLDESCYTQKNLPSQSV